jgi:hypothetical protein
MSRPVNRKFTDEQFFEIYNNKDYWTKLTNFHVYNPSGLKPPSQLFIAKKLGVSQASVWHFVKRHGGLDY